MKHLSVEVLHSGRRKVYCSPQRLSQLTSQVSRADLERAFSHEMGSLLPTKKISFLSPPIKGLLVPNLCNICDWVILQGMCSLRL